jgi:hypothetical protein
VSGKSKARATSWALRNHGFPWLRASEGDVSEIALA